MKTIKAIALGLIVASTLASTPATTALAASKSLDAEFRRSDIRMPTTMKAGQKYDVVIKVKNSGDIRWQGRQFRMKGKIRRSPSGAPAQREELTPDVDLVSVVNTGEVWDCHFSVHAPTWTGHYELQYSMAEGNNEFGDKVDVDVDVVGK